MQNVIVLNADLKILNNLVKYTRIEKAAAEYNGGSFFYMLCRSIIGRMIYRTYLDYDTLQVLLNKQLEIVILRK